MTLIMRVKARWAGFSGGPGYTVLHFRDFGTGTGGGTDPDSTQAAAAVVRVADAFSLIRTVLPSIVTVTTLGEVDLLEDTTGELVDSYTVTQGGVITGSATGNFSAASGAVLNWKTAGIRNGRRIRGRSFIVPLASTAYGADGALSSTARTTLSGMASSLASSSSTPDLGVYARPTAPGAADGRWSAVTSGSVPTNVAILRSRRD